jgi:hypothetical protein
MAITDPTNDSGGGESLVAPTIVTTLAPTPPYPVDEGSHQLVACTGAGKAIATPASNALRRRGKDAHSETGP